MAGQVAKCPECGSEALIKTGSCQMCTQCYAAIGACGE